MVGGKVEKGGREVLMNLRQQIISDRIVSASERLSVNEDRAFMLFASSLVTGRSLADVDEADIVDGGGDKQIDVFSIEQDGDEVCVHIMQIKNTRSFSSNVLVQMKNGLHWIFTKARKDVKGLPNVKLKDKILEYRSVVSDVGPSNISVHVWFVTNGRDNEKSDEFLSESKSLVSEYDNGVFQTFTFEAIGSDRLVLLINQIEQKSRNVDTDISIRYDVNNPSLIKYVSGGLKGLVCTVSGDEIARIVQDDTSGAIFDSNVRRFLGTRGAVNKDILSSCISEDDGQLFWFLNNGVTVVCDWFDAVADSDDPKIKIKNMQIVNGCQTATTIAYAKQKKILKSGVKVLVRVYETNRKSLVDRFVLSTNNQNRVTDRDLRANDNLQIDIERGFKLFGLYYERKPKQYDKDNNVNLWEVVSNEHVAQAYLAIVLGRASDARRRKYKVWGDLYHEIFKNQHVELYVAPYVMAKVTKNFIDAYNYRNNESLIFRKVASNGLYHVARAASLLWLGNDIRAVPNLKEKIDELYDRQSKYYEKSQDAFLGVCDLIGKNKSMSSDIDKALKSSTLDAAIDSKFFPKKRGGVRSQMLLI